MEPPSSHLKMLFKTFSAAVSESTHNLVRSREVDIAVRAFEGLFQRCGLPATAVPLKEEPQRISPPCATCGFRISIHSLILLN